MIDEEVRQAVLLLKQRNPNFGARRIGRILQISRGIVGQILESGSAQLPVSQRPLHLTPHLETIRQLFTQCEGSLVRVAEELNKTLELPVAYSTLTAFCRHHEFGTVPQNKQPAGRYETEPGLEMQHDTSPIRITVGGIKRLYQAASLKLGYSRMRFLFFYRRFRRFECKDFLTRAFEFFGGLCTRCVIDNTSVIVAGGTGPAALMAPEISAFEKRFGFAFWAHKLGDANRSAKVERDFSFVQNNFVKGRAFADDVDLNAQAREWCVKKNNTRIEHTPFIPAVLFEAEKPHLKRLPAYVPSVNQLHTRRVDAEGFVSLDGNRYSAPAEVLRKMITLRETLDSVTLLEGHRTLCVHPRLPDGARQENTLAEHKRRPRSRQRHQQPWPEEAWLAAQSPTLKSYLAGIKQRGGRRVVYQIRKLYALCHSYAVADVERLAIRAAEYDLFDAARLETMLLQELGAKLFGLPPAQNTAAAPGVSTRPPGHVTPVAVDSEPSVRNEPDCCPPQTQSPDLKGGDTDV